MIDCIAFVVNYVWSAAQKNPLFCLNVKSLYSYRLSYGVADAYFLCLGSWSVMSAEPS